MSRFRIAVGLLGFACAASAAGADLGSKPFRVIVPFTPGSGSDTLGRLFAPKIGEAFGQQVVVDNRPGAGSTIGTALVGAATPDGHTLLVTSSGFAGSASIYPKLPYDPIKDFAGITQLIANPLVLVVSPSFGVKSMQALIVLAKQKPGQITYASTGVGSGTHYGAELFRLAAKFEATHVPFKGVPEALTDTMTGRVNFYLPPVLVVVPLAKAGRVIALAVTSAQRSPLLPDVPTPAEAGLPEFVYDGWYGMFAPGKTPRPVIERLSKEMQRILALPEINDKIVAMGGRTKWSPPEDFDRMVRTEIQTRAKVFEAAGVTAR
ncbi:MAG: tripartite tricarboxylate transporter substrate binding protein [Burkholderiales bacterium]